MTFTNELWGTITPIFGAITDHPYNRELADGTLPRDKFKYYLKQDALYLVDFARALAVVASKAETPERIISFLDFAREGIVVERALHQEYFKRFDVALDAGLSPSCFAYTNYLLATASHRSYEEAVGALLPCFWIYREVGLHIVERSAPGNPYQLWVDTYAGEEFGEAVRCAVDITDDVAAMASDRARRQMMEAFVISSRLEWMFWDGAYRMEEWGP
ncbi:MAG: thiaminase II [Bacteroidetes bacterium]|nr:thiaminase II [Bacteroidota bacterium]